MGFFNKQFANVVEWEEFREDMIFWKWSNREIKRGSNLIIRPGQDAIFLDSGKIEGIFKDEGSYDMETQIIPFLSTLKGFKFGFKTGMRAEVLFVNTREFTVKWGTKNPILLPAPGLPGGMPIRANGTFNFKVNDYIALIDKIAGVKDTYLVEDVQIRITSVLDQLLMKWISKEGKDMFNLQANAADISKGIQEDLDMDMMQNGITITGFNIMSVNYPEEIQRMLTKVASQGMVGDMDKYQKVAVIDGMDGQGRTSAVGTAGDMAGMMMGMNMASQMMDSTKANTNTNQQENQNQNQEQQEQQDTPPSSGEKPNFCPNCGEKSGEANFCPNCGNKLA